MKNYFLMHHQTNSAYRFSLYRNLTFFDQPDVAIDVNQLYEIIKDGYLEKEIKTLRKVCNNEEICNKIIMGHLPAVTLSGIFGVRNNSGLVRHSGLIQMELLIEENYETLFSEICKDVYTYLAFRSPVGKGVKVVVKIRDTVETHLDQYLALEEYYKKNYQVETDASLKDISSAMPLSHDPGIYCNPEARVFLEIFEKQKPEMSISYKAEENKPAIQFTDKNKELHAEPMKMPFLQRKPKVRVMHQQKV